MPADGPRSIDERECDTFIRKVHKEADAETRWVRAEDL